MTVPETSAPYVRSEVAGGFATVTLDSPHNRNAISSRLVGELRQALADAAADDSVRAVVLTHTGGTFCAGADLSEAGGASDADPAELAAGRTAQMTELLREFLELPKPIVARIDGHVRAGGMGLVGACDIAIAGPSSTFALTEARLGLAASIISLTVLPRMTSRAAGRYFLTGEKFGPAEAERLGLITIASEDAAVTVAEVCAELALASPQGLAESKRLTTARMLADFDRYGEELAAQSARLFGSPEAVEGMTAFFQRRPPAWVPSE
ncbi:enoyl-CoA hydratase [Rhodococcus sp. OK611]|uniref:enoyl-CoA hydratase family protein n=1 Tax=unclassified Rhodococcus (in: high G+C Gram-positive bacteria) TaxID=192944 RepID=UPI000BCAB20D|nr:MULTISPECIES: enoyl-CoA hydratase family protein [unclassified Rhodococcus (in: high G+C Gram-positive bacteria)]PTR44006.1 enoyl-CoA hydratase [Rhodococcus sp. OK611]SNX90308.1 enoyl-CoA hydratase [Rhodococcus sp. OK270]